METTSRAAKPGDAVLGALNVDRLAKLNASRLGPVLEKATPEQLAALEDALTQRELSSREYQILRDVRALRSGPVEPTPVVHAPEPRRPGPGDVIQHSPDIVSR